MVYLPLPEVCMMGEPSGEDTLLTSGVTTTAQTRPDSDVNFGRLQAINLDTLELVRAHREKTPSVTAALATAGSLVFSIFLFLRGRWQTICCHCTRPAEPFCGQS